MLAEYASTGKTKDERLAMVALCERVSWDYHTYCSQPAWFIDLLLQKIKIDDNGRK